MWGKCTEKHTWMCQLVASTWRQYALPNLWCLRPSYRWPFNAKIPFFLLVWLEGENCDILSLMQNPGLTAGQRHYLCSIASVYSTEHMRRQMKQHYLNVLHTCLQSGVFLNVWNTSSLPHPSHVISSCLLKGQNDTCRRKYGHHQRRENSTFPKDAEEDTARANKPQRQRKSSDRANCDVTLPKIVNRWTIISQ